MRPITALALVTFITACEEDTPTAGTNEACDGVVVEWDQPVIDVDTTFSCTVRYAGDLSVRGAKLTLEPGARLELGGDSRVFVSDGGILHAVGTPDLPVTITSSNSVPVAGDWRTIDIKSTADGATRFEHAIIEYGGGTSSETPLTGGGSFDLVDVTVRHAPRRGLSLEGGSVRALTRVHVEDVGANPVEIGINDVEVIDGLTADRVGEATILVHAGRPLEVDATWGPEEMPYELRGSVSLQADLTVEPGVDIVMTPATRMFVQDGGTFDLLGTEEAPIVLQSAAESPQPGDWQQVNFKSDADGSLWQHAIIRHGGSNAGVVYIEADDRLSLDNVVFEDNDVCDIDAIIGVTYNVPSVDTSYVLCDS